MAKGKYKASAEKRIEAETIAQLTRKVQELTEENEKLKQQAIQDSLHLAYILPKCTSRPQGLRPQGFKS